MNQIDYWILPKGFLKTEPEEKSAILTNKDFDKKIKIDKAFYLIKAPIELHLISVLWIMKVGYILESPIEPDPYGNKLQLKEKGKGVVSGLKLFKPYFKEYQKWRDKAISAAKNLLTNEKVDVAIVGMDVKNYFDSVQLDFDDLVYNLNSLHKEKDFNLKNYDILTSLLKEIHLQYYNTRKDYKPEGNKVGLPIGLLSSGVLANWYLKEFDLNVKDKLNPVYYGRYVDDILIVIANPKYDGETSNKDLREKFLKKYFLDRGILAKAQGKDDFIINEANLEVQKTKLSLMYFDCSEPLTLLDNFEYEIRKNSSEFRFLPEEYILENEFQQEANSVVYSGSKFKLTSVRNLTPDKFGASKFLAKKIFSTLQADNLKDKETVGQLLKFFKNQRAIEFYHLWEKLITYFVVSNQIYGIRLFLANLKEVFNDNLNVLRRATSEEMLLINSLREYLRVSVAVALALSPSSLDERLTKLIREVTNNPRAQVSNLIRAIRGSNMIRHNYIFLPLFNYTRFSTENNFSLVDKNLSFKQDSNDRSNLNGFDFEDYIFKFSPRFVHFHEVALYVIRKTLYGFKHGLDNQKSDLPLPNFTNYLDEAFELFYKINYLHSNKEINPNDEKYKKLKDQYFAIKSGSYPAKPYVDLDELVIADHEKKKNLKVALGNIMIHHENMQQSYFKKPIISGRRKAEINSLLNQVYTESKVQKVDLFVLPEVSIPYKWLGWMTEYCRKHQVMMVFGMEHWPINNIAYNFIVTLLPTKVNSYESGEATERNFNALIPVLRIKNHYSPREVKELKGYRYNIPVPSPNSYHLFIWKGLHFAVFNCFELADISHRALFKSKVDFIVASEYNRDVNYFSNIVESVSRDLHCYFIQSNNSIFGDNRITRPGKTDSKDLIKLKGGKNTTIVVDTINIDAIRRFQLMDHNLQMGDKSFKPTPPWYDIDELEKRMGFDLNS